MLSYVRFRISSFDSDITSLVYFDEKIQKKYKINKKKIIRKEGKEKILTKKKIRKEVKWTLAHVY